MRLLLDTQPIILAAQDRLPATARRAIADADSRTYSLVSFWEIGIEAARGTLRLALTLSELHSLVASELVAEELPLQIEAIEIATRFPFHHKDPFDRLLAAQAIVSGRAIVSADPVFEEYGCKRVW